MSLREDVSGEYRDALVALRDRLAEEVERVAEEGFCPHCKRGSSSIAPLSKQLADVLRELSSLKQPEGSIVDEIAKRRSERGAKVSDRPAVGDERSGAGRGRTRAGRRTGS